MSIGLSRDRILHLMVSALKSMGHKNEYVTHFESYNRVTYKH